MQAKGYALKLVLSFVLIFSAFFPVAQADPAKKCVQVYYDKLPDNPNDTLGRVNVIYIQNLLGHFSNVQQYILPIRSYKSGDLEKCAASMYIGTNYGDVGNIPTAFYKDFLKTQKNVLWMKYGIWRYSEKDLKSLWGVKYQGTDDIDNAHPDANGKPGYFNAFSYKGETFDAYGEFDKQDPKKFVYSSDIVLLDPVDNLADSYVVSWAQHSTRAQKVPYILRNKNHWYVADSPFNYITSGDRYFIFSDILFDVLNEPPVNGGKKFALVRFEDVSDLITPSIQQMVDMFGRQKIPFGVSVIPIYNDPLHVYNFKHYVEMNQDPQFVKMLHYAVDHGGSLIMHGVTHQYDSQKNPFTGVSGEDFEFWDKPNASPIKEDSVEYVLQRLAKGVQLIEDANLTIYAWMTPHYLASSLDNVIFGQVFSWNVGQVNYVLNKACNFKTLPDSLTFDIGGVDPKISAKRMKYLSKLKVVNIKNADVNDQYQPYELYGDYYGQRLIPATLGNVQPYLSNQVLRIRTVDDILRDARRLTVLRDAWASFFIHAILLNTTDRHGLAKTPGDTSELERLISGIKALGFEFIDLKTWAPAHLKARRPEPIEPEPFPASCD